MWSFLPLIIYCIIAESTEQVYGSHAVIGNYTDLNHANCGVSRFFESYSFEPCFEWHSYPFSPLKDGRDAIFDETPWMAHIKIEIDEVDDEGNITHSEGYCAGSLIADQWIITANHCVQHYGRVESNITVDLGSRPYSDQEFYPRDAGRVIEIKHCTIDYSDLALLKLERPVSQINYPFLVRSICLPAPHIRPKYYPPHVEVAMRAGRGQNNITYDPVQVGNITIRVSEKTMVTPEGSTDYWEDYMRLRIYSIGRNDTFGCAGDSGGPLWQYSLGRAVLIGVYVMSLHVEGGHCSGWGLPSDFMRVSEFIDWIKNVTQLE